MPFPHATSLSLADMRNVNAMQAIVFICLALASLMPIILVEIPAMVDYPNHLARMSILARAGTANAHPLYEVNWALYPNLAMDIIVPPLARWIGVELATKLFYLASQLLIISGAMTLSWAARGKVFSAGIIACLFLYAIPFAFGFVNFEFALGLSLSALAAWIALAERPLAVRLAVHTIAVLTLFFAHLFALGIYGFTIGIIELWRVRRESPPLRQVIGLFLGMAAPAAAIAALLVFAGNGVGGGGTLWDAGYKIFWIGMLNGWSRQVAFVLSLLLFVPLFVALASRWLSFVGPGSWLALGFGGLFVIMPFRFLDTGFVDGRVLIASILILPAFITATWPNRAVQRSIWALVAGVCIANITYVTWVQTTYRTEYRQLLQAFDRMPKGSRLIASDRLEGNDPPLILFEYPMLHSATLAVYSRDAFVPTLFTHPGKQPLRANVGVQHLSVAEGAPIVWKLLETYNAGAEPDDFSRYARTWWLDFDYLLMLHPDGSNPRPDLLDPIAASERFALYRIKTRK